MTRRFLTKIPRPFVACVIVVLTAPSAVRGADWAGSVGDYNAGANWVGGVAPAANVEATISSGQATISANLSRAAITNVNGAGQLTINGRLLNGQGGAGVINVADNGVLSQTGNYFIVSQGNFDSAINQTGGTINATVDRGFFMTDGGAPNPGSGTINALGGVFNASFTTTNPNDNLHNFQAGRRGANDLFYVNGGDVNFMTTVANRRMYFSQNSRLQVDSGTFDANGFEFFVVGYGTSLNGGNVNGTSRMVVNGGTSTVNLTPTGAFVVSDGQSGIVEVKSGALNVAGRMVIGGDVSANNNIGRGDVVQTGGALSVTGEIAVGVNAPGTLRMIGGTLNAGSVTKGAQADSYFGLEGGTVVLNGDATSIVNQPWFVAPYGATATYNSGLDKTTITRNVANQRIRLEVNTQTGEAKIKNPNGALTFTADYYEIRSAQGALVKANWNSLDEQIPDGGKIPGDYNGDGVDNGADFLAWQRSFGSTAVPPGTGADGDGNGTVNGGDLTVWKNNFGSTGGGIGAGWTEAGGSNANLLAEYFLDEANYTLAANATFSLGNIFNTSTFGVGAPGDLTFSIEMPNGYLATGEVVYVTSGSAAAVPEPATLVIALTAAAVGVAHHRRRGVA